MADQPVVVRIQVENDARLIAAVAAGTACCGSSAGLGDEEAEALRGAVRAGCEYSFGGGFAGTLDAEIRCSAGRLEVALARPVAAGFQAAPPALAGVDQTQQEMRGDRMVLILTKSLRPPVQAE